MSRKNFILFLFGFGALLFTGCRPSVHSLKALQEYIDNGENGLVHRVENNGIQYQMSYLPSAYIALQNHGNDLPESSYDSLCALYNNYIYFKLRLTRNDKDLINTYANSSEFDGVVNYFTNEIGSDLKLISKGEEFPVYDFISARAYEASSATEVLFVFDFNIQDQDDMLTLKFNTRKFDSGAVQFNFSPKDIRSLPTLVLNERL